MKPKLVNSSRWLAFIPAAILGGTAAMFAVHLLMVLISLIPSFGPFANTTESEWKAAMPAAEGVCFVRGFLFSGLYVAPYNREQAAKLLGGILLVVLGWVAWIAVRASDWPNLWACGVSAIALFGHLAILRDTFSSLFREDN